MRVVGGCLAVCCCQTTGGGRQGSGRGDRATAGVRASVGTGQRSGGVRDGGMVQLGARGGARGGGREAGGGVCGGERGSRIEHSAAIDDRIVSHRGGLRGGSQRPHPFSVYSKEEYQPGGGRGGYRGGAGWGGGSIGYASTFGERAGKMGGFEGHGKGGGVSGVPERSIRSRGWHRWGARRGPPAEPQSPCPRRTGAASCTGAGRGLVGGGGRARGATQAAGGGRRTQPRSPAPHKGRRKRMEQEGKKEQRKERRRPGAQGFLLGQGCPTRTPPPPLACTQCGAPPT